MITPKQRKQNIIDTINKNPTKIIIIQTEEVLKGGHLDQQQIKKELKIRIYHQKHPEVSVLSDKKGIYHSSRRYGMLVDYTADIKVDSRQSIEFDTAYGTMKVTAVYPQIVQGEVCGYQCDLERMN